MKSPTHKNNPKVWSRIKWETVTVTPHDFGQWVQVSLRKLIPSQSSRKECYTSVSGTTRFPPCSHLCRALKWQATKVTTSPKESGRTVVSLNNPCMGKKPGVTPRTETSCRKGVSPRTTLINTRSPYTRKVHWYEPRGGNSQIHIAWPSAYFLC